MKNTTVVMTLSDLADFVTFREKQAQLELVEDHIAPYNANKARSLVKKIKSRGLKPLNGNTRKRKVNTAPRELVVKVLRGREEDFSDIQQYLVREA